MKPSAVSPAPLDSGTPKSKEPRLKHRCSGPLGGASSRLIGGRCNVRDMQETTTSNNKNREKEDGDGHIFYPAVS
ncbi:Hypothetical predicted protein [Xyrichtys novacula]|uniref:Uncharacterized protein n=1 Tax=Xyrichtys novacula TaxID=13765 RepID=A0AAV1H8Z9_XYRNO|nr:Hypothetical predicted protein [Xyrichtys novacula]